MSIKFKTKIDPQKIISDLKKAIDEGKIVTWSYDQDGDFTHTTEQWKNQAWLRPKIEGGDLVFYIIKPKNQNISVVIYGIYHGRFIESMLKHFDSEFTSAVASALPEGKDMVS